MAIYYNIDASFVKCRKRFSGCIIGDKSTGHCYLQHCILHAWCCHFSRVTSVVSGPLGLKLILHHTKEWYRQKGLMQRAEQGLSKAITGCQCSWKMKKQSCFGPRVLYSFICLSIYFLICNSKIIPKFPVSKQFLISRFSNSFNFFKSSSLVLVLLGLKISILIKFASTFYSVSNFQIFHDLLKCFKEISK